MTGRILVACEFSGTVRRAFNTRGLSISIVRNELNLIVEDFGTDLALAEFQKLLVAYYRLLKDYMTRRAWDYVVQTRESRFVYGDRAYG